MPCRTVPIDDSAPDAAPRLVIALPLAEPSPPDQPHPVPDTSPSTSEDTARLVIALPLAEPSPPDQPHPVPDPSPSTSEDTARLEEEDCATATLLAPTSVASPEVFHDTIDEAPNAEDEGVDAEPTSPRRVHISADVLRRILRSAGVDAVEYVFSGLDNDPSSSDSSSESDLSDHESLVGRGLVGQDAEEVSSASSDASASLEDLVQAEFARNISYRTRSPVTPRRLRARVDYRVLNPELDPTGPATARRSPSPAPTSTLSGFLSRSLVPLMPSHEHYPGIGTTCPICYVSPSRNSNPQIQT